MLFKEYGNKYDGINHGGFVLISSKDDLKEYERYDYFGVEQITDFPCICEIYENVTSRWDDDFYKQDRTIKQVNPTSKEIEDYKHEMQLAIENYEKHLIDFQREIDKRKKVIDTLDNIVINEQLEMKF